MQHLTDEALDHVADYFRALGDPMRLRILNRLREGPHNVGELTQQLQCSQANVSKHLSTLARLGLVQRDARGTSVFYGITDPNVFALCDLVCGQLGRHFEHTARLGAMFRPPAQVPAKRARAPRAARAAAAVAAGKRAVPRRTRPSS